MNVCRVSGVYVCGVSSAGITVKRNMKMDRKQRINQGEPGAITTGQDGTVPANDGII